jgi:O-antigen ligase
MKFENYITIHAATCWLIIAAIISVLLAPPLVSIAEIILALLIVTSNELRNKMFIAWQQPLFKAVLIFYILITIGVLYSAAPVAIAVKSWWSWRKLLLLPLSLALFNNVTWKDRLILTFISIVTIAAIASFIAWFIEYSPFAPNGEPGVLLRNRITQGMAFSVAAFSAFILTLRKFNYDINRWLIISSLILIINIILVTPGRSGYLALIVLVFIGTVNYLRNKHWSWISSVEIASLIACCLVIILTLTPTSQQRLNKGIKEATNYQQYDTETSIGIRIIYWQNTLSLSTQYSFQHLLIGHGTGAFGTAYTQHVLRKPGLAGIPVDDPHNQYLRIWIEYGLIGLIIFNIMLITAAWQQPITFPYRILGLAVMIAWCVTSLANSHFTTFAEGTFIYLWLGSILAAEKNPQRA